MLLPCLETVEKNVLIYVHIATSMTVGMYTYVGTQVTADAWLYKKAVILQNS